MIKTKEELLKLVPRYHMGYLSSFKNNTLYYWNATDMFFYDKGKGMNYLTHQQAIDLYNNQQFSKEFLDKL